MTARIELHQGDITRLALDAIVNAANEQLLPGGGVCGAIHRAAGPKLAEACRAIGHCATGAAAITPGFDLPAGHVIHAVGPVWHGGGQGEAALLAGAYTSALALCAKHGLKTVAFPAISTGIYGYPLAEAAKVAVGTVRAWLEPLPERVVFALFGEAAEKAFGRALETT
jgi:O-acetyl-ADP-ribose deacetylase (regulator of RNase III)